MRVPLARPEITDDDVAAVTRVLRSSRLSQGPVLRAFEESLASYAGVQHAVAMNSGTSALQLALCALGVGQGDEVILPSFSFMAVTNAVLNLRAVPVFVDIEEGSFNLDPAHLDRAVGPKTKAIIAVHTFGFPAWMEEIIYFARERGLYVIEDACEALGTEIAGRKAGSFGDVSIFAFYPNKQITTGEGGALLTDSAVIAAAARRWRNQGREGSDEWFQNVDTGHSYRLSDINCALGLQQLTRIEEILKKREALAQSYHQRLMGNENATLYRSRPGRTSWFTYPVLLKADRDQIWRELNCRGVECARYFPPAHLQPVMKQFPSRWGDLSNTISAAERVLCLPFFNSMTDEEVGFVCECLQEVLASHQRTLATIAGPARPALNVDTQSGS